jgi:ferredoxin-thioredoxin reductase catalytic subunit
LNRDEIVSNILEFAEVNKLHILPGHDVTKWVNAVIKENGCPCVPSRKGDCPCEYALDDIKQNHCCRCHLFVDDVYLEEYNRLTKKKKSHRG